MEALIVLSFIVFIAVVFELKDRKKYSDYAKRKEDFKRYHDKTFTKWWER